MGRESRRLLLPLAGEGEAITAEGDPYVLDNDSVILGEGESCGQIDVHLSATPEQNIG